MDHQKEEIGGGERQNALIEILYAKLSIGAAGTL